MAAPTWTAGSQLRPSIEDVLGLGPEELSDPPEVVGVSPLAPALSAVLDEPVALPAVDGILGLLPPARESDGEPPAPPRPRWEPGRSSIDDILDYLRGFDVPPSRPEPGADLAMLIDVAVDASSDSNVEEASPPPPVHHHHATGGRPRRKLLVLLLVALVAGGWRLMASGSSPRPAAAPAAPYALSTRDAYTTLVAQSRVGQVGVFEAPDDRDPGRVLDHPTPTGGPLVFLVVDDSRPGWLRVQLPVRPNGSTGWIRRSDVTVQATRYKVSVSLTRHRLEVFEGPEMVLATSIAVGTEDTPTPGGRFYITELIQPATADTVYGTYVFGLSGYSNVLEEFNGGAGVIGIHGTNDPSVIGQDVSAGCIRLTNEAIEELVGRLPLGTPVAIAA